MRDPEILSMLEPYQGKRLPFNLVVYPDREDLTLHHRYCRLAAQEPVFLRRLLAAGWTRADCAMCSQWMLDSNNPDSDDDEPYYSE
jgi:hypothetical protein